MDWLTDIKAAIADLDETDAVFRSYTWRPGIDNLLAITVHDAVTVTYFALTDHLGTVHALADDTGTIVESYRFDAWGNLLGVYDATGTPIPNQQSAISNRFLFHGREYSWTTGLYNFRARWYDPITGRWLSNDPIGIAGGLNQYVFCANNPLMFVDPEGLRWSRDVWKSASHGFMEGLSRGAQGVVNAFTGGLFVKEAGIFYGAFNRQWEDLGYHDNAGDRAFDCGMAGGRVAEAFLLAAGAAWAMEAAGWIHTTPQGNNIIRIIIKPLRRGWRLDKPHHGRWIHQHFWKW